MTKKKVFTASALEDMLSIANYYKEELQSPEQAMRLQLQFQNKTEILKKFPELYPYYETEANLKFKYRFLSVKSYLIFYYVSSDTVFIKRIIYSKRNIKEILNKTEVNDDLQSE